MIDQLSLILDLIALMPLAQARVVKFSVPKCFIVFTVNDLHVDIVTNYRPLIVIYLSVLFYII